MSAQLEHLAGLPQFVAFEVINPEKKREKVKGLQNVISGLCYIDELDKGIMGMGKKPTGSLIVTNLSDCLALDGKCFLLSGDELDKFLKTMDLQARSLSGI